MNPYTPGSGLQPVELVGRDSEIAAFDRIIARGKLRFSERGMILSGLRGVGKTVLLRRFHDHAENKGWMTAFIEGQANDAGVVATRNRLSRGVVAAARSYDNRNRASRFASTVKDSIESFSLAIGTAGISTEVSLTARRAGSGQIDVDFEELVEDLCAPLIRDNSALGLFIDEMQDLDPDLLTAILATQHLAGQRKWPFYVIGAGLPHLPAILSDNKSYAERLFDYRSIGPVDADAAREALTIPARRYGADYEDAAVDLITEAAEGYPYFLQEFGKSAWNLAEESPITPQDADLAIAEGYIALDVGFFPARWTRATPAERRYLRAMAASPNSAPRTGEIVAWLRANAASDLSVIRAELIRKGLIYAPEHGRVAFTVPGMADFINREQGDPHDH